MLVSYNWLKELVDFPYSPEELADVLTRQGMTVDSLDRFGQPYDNVVVGRLVDVAQHPNADKLSVCRVDVGGEALQIVCGAPGIKAGQHVPVALIGARLGDFKIKKTKLRGVESCGMCCAADELGIAGDHESLLSLDTALEPGTPFESVIAGEDYLLELDIPNNRPDLLCHIGVAREIAAHLALESGKAESYSPPAVELDESSDDAAARVKVRIDDTKLCPRYTARVIDNVTIGPSPLWMQARLYRLGMRPINNIVDITNYVLLEYGHPLHAFDYARIAGPEIVVRRARAGETIVTLDDAERRLDEETLLIADAEKGIALAGVMGGANSEVTENTESVLLESAYFHGPNIRRTAKLLDLQSESSYRFERNVRGALIGASKRAAQLMSQCAGGTVLKGIVDEDHCAKPARFSFNYRKCTTLLGLDIPREKGANILNSLGFSLAAGKGDDIEITVPEHRVDINEGPDIAEELARVVGYGAIPTDTDVKHRSETPPVKTALCRERIRDALSGTGLFEAYNASLVSIDLLRAAGIPEDAPECAVVPLANASTQEQSVMRTVLYPGLLRNLQHNIAHGAKAVWLFEIGRVYMPGQDGRRFIEQERLALLLWGDARAEGCWEKARETDFHDGVSVAEALLRKLAAAGVEVAPASRPGCHSGRTAEISARSDGERVRLGWMAELDPRVLRKLDVAGRVVVAELDVEALAEVWHRDRQYRSLPRFPAATRDVAFFLPEQHAHADVCRVIESEDVDILESVRLFDVYRGEQVPAGHKSMAYRMTYRAGDRTLTDDEVDTAHKSIVSALVGKLDVEVR